MKDMTETIRKYSLDEVALFAIFALGVLAAFMLVTSRSRITMADPVELEGSGLAISLPTGRGWTSQKWTYSSSNEFAAAATLNVGTQVVAAVQYSYLIAPLGTDVPELIEQAAEAARMTITRSGSIAAGSIDVTWVQLETPLRSSDTFLGVAVLPTAKILEIDVRAPNDRLLASKLFRSIIDSIQYSYDQRAAAGAEFVGRIKTVGIDSLIAKYGGYAGETVFMIDDDEGRPAGFLIRMLTRKADQQDWAAQKLESARYISGSRGITFGTSLELSENMNRFLWRTASSTLQTLPVKTELELSAEGMIRVSSGRAGDMTYKPGPATIPEMCLDIAMPMLLDSSDAELVVDVLFSGGQIVPALMKVVDVSADDDNVWEASYSVRLELLTEQKRWLQTYFDDEKRLVGKIESSPDKLTWHKSTRQELKDQFGDLERYLGRHGVLQ